MFYCLSCAICLPYNIYLLFFLLLLLFLTQTTNIFQPPLGLSTMSTFYDLFFLLYDFDYPAGVQYLSKNEDTE